MKLVKTLIVGTVGLSLLGLVAPAFAQNEYAEQLTALGKGEIHDLAQNPVVVAAVKAQNAETAGYDQAKIDSLDAEWRTEVDSASKPLIDKTMGTEASQFLSSAQNDAEGLFTEIFVTDAKGLNVAQSTVTSDYWQGDEAKFTESFGKGADAIYLGDIEQDESTQAYQSQVSIPVVDPDTGAPIGSITVGVDLSMI